MSHGQAALIRSSIESQTFDLAGQNVATIENTIRDAFSEPMELSEMIRLTFITGAGKLGRARYDDNAAKAVTSTLRELGYEEDRGASAVMDCAGLFKLQHDTGKNLKTVVVFPKVVSKESNNDNNVDGITSGFSSLIVEDSLDHKLAYTSMNVFPRMIESQCLTWSQKKACIATIQQIQSMLNKLDDNLLKGQQLSEQENLFYNSLTATSLEEKVACVRDLMQKQVEKGQIVVEEKQLLISQVETKLKEIQSNISAAESEAKPKRVENLKEAEKNAIGRKEKLNSIIPKPPPKLKNEIEINKLRTELIPLLELENSTKGRLLTLKESQSIARKDEIQNLITELELTSRGWFESDEAFDNRVELSRKNWQLSRPKSTTNKKTSSTAATAGGKWSTASNNKTSSSSKSTKSTQKKSTSGGGLFAAMMQDSDSD